MCCVVWFLRRGLTAANKALANCSNEEAARSQFRDGLLGFNGAPVSRGLVGECAYPFAPSQGGPRNEEAWNGPSQTTSPRGAPTLPHRLSWDREAAPQDVCELSIPHAQQRREEAPPQCHLGALPPGALVFASPGTSANRGLRVAGPDPERLCAPSAGPLGIPRTSP